MDCRQKKMIVVPQQKVKIEDDDDDDDDLEALRLAALKSLRTKDTTHNRKSTVLQVQNVFPQIMQSSHFAHKNQRSTGRNFYNSRTQQRQNGNVYYQSPRNPNLIAIVPVDEPASPQQTRTVSPIELEKTETRAESYSPETSKFHRFKDNGSASEEEDIKDLKRINIIKTEIITKRKSDESCIETKNKEETIVNIHKNGDQEKDVIDDDDDVLLMADLEEEDSLERLMDEMEKEMNVDKPSEKRERKSNRKEIKEITKNDEKIKNFDPKTKLNESCRKEKNNIGITNAKHDRKSVSPHTTNRIIHKRRSLSPRSRSRKKSPRKSPLRQVKKSPRESRYRSPRRSPSRYSPRSRSPKLSPRRSPNKAFVKRSPLRKLSPRGRSSLSRSPRPLRSRSPRILSESNSPRPYSPKMSSSRSPRLSRSRSPRFSPLRLSPRLRLTRSRSPRLSPRRLSPRRLSSRSRSPDFSSPRRGSSRLRSPKLSPRRTSPRLRSPRASPRRSPWSSPKHSPRHSPRRRRSPKWSPKELSKRHGPFSVTPDNLDDSLYLRESSPSFKDRTMLEASKIKVKQKDEPYEKKPVTEATKDLIDTINDPILEARRKKFESTRPIDPINANKKIKLCKNYNVSTKTESLEGIDIRVNDIKKINTTSEEYDISEVDLCLETSYEFDDFDGAEENTFSPVITNLKNPHIEQKKPEKEKSTKKKRKRDKEIYQVGKLKSELPLSERIGKDKKCKKRKENIVDGQNEDVETIFEDITIDEEGDLRTELSRRRAERLNRTVPIQSARLVQSAFKGVVNEAVKNNAKVNQRHVINTDEKSNPKEIRRVTVLRRTMNEVGDSEDETALDSKVPVRFRLGLNKQAQESRDAKVIRKTSKRQSRKE